MDKVLNSSKDVIKVNLVKTNEKWMREHFAYNVREDLAIKVMANFFDFTEKNVEI